LSIREFLLREPPPEWEFRLDTWTDRPWPSIRLLRLETLLLAQALAAVEAGDEQSGRWLEAAWKLRQSTSHWLGWTRARALPILRLLEHPEVSWDDRLEEFDGRAQARADQLLEAWTALRVLEKGETPITDYYDLCTNDADDGWSNDVARFVTLSWPFRAYGRVAIQEAARRQRDLLDHIVTLDPCQLLAGEYPESIADSDPWWNRMSNFVFPQQHALWARVGRNLLEAELTARVLQARSLRNAAGSWPETVPGIERSSCAGGRWCYRREADGSVLIDFEVEGNERLRRHIADPGPLVFRAR
jgi:hypothetical protein